MLLPLLYKPSALESVTFHELVRRRSYKGPSVCSFCIIKVWCLFFTLLDFVSEYNQKYVSFLAPNIFFSVNIQLCVYFL